MQGGDFMEHSYRFRIYPTKEQTIQIQRTFGCCRFVYNYYLAKRIDAYKSDKTTLGYKACAADMTALKKQLPWLGEVDSIALQSSLRDLDTAYQNFFRRVSRASESTAAATKANASAPISRCWTVRCSSRSSAMSSAASAARWRAECSLLLCHRKPAANTMFLSAVPTWTSSRRQRPEPLSA